MKTSCLQKNIQNGWLRVKLGDISSLRKGLTYKSSNYSNGQDGMIFLTLKSIQRGGGFNNDGVKYYVGDYDEGVVVKEGDLVIANTDITRDAAVVGAPMLLPKMNKNPILISMDLSVLDVEQTRVSNHFLYYTLQTKGARNFMRDHSNGSTVLHLRTKDVPNFELNLPPISEQQKIAEILGMVDEDITKTQEVIEATERLKCGLIQDLFSCGIGHLKFKKTKIGEIPEEWSVVKLNELATITRGGSPRPIENFITNEDDGLNWLKIGDIESGGKYITYTSQKIKKSGLSKTTLVHEGDFILSNSMSFGRPYIMKIDACIHDGWLAFKDVKTNLISSEFLYYLLSSKNLQNNFGTIAAGSGVKNLKKESVSNVAVALPPVKEQEKIAEILSTVDEKILVNKKLKEKLTLLKKGLMQDLLSGNKRVII